MQSNTSLSHQAEVVRRFQSEPYVHLAVGRDAPMTPLNVSITSAAEMSHIQPAQPQVCC